MGLTGFIRSETDEAIVLQERAMTDSHRAQLHHTASGILDIDFISSCLFLLVSSQ